MSQYLKLDTDVGYGQQFYSQVRAHKKRIPVVTKDTRWLDIDSTVSPGGSELGAAETQ